MVKGLDRLLSGECEQHTDDYDPDFAEKLSPIVNRFWLMNFHRVGRLVNDWNSRLGTGQYRRSRNCISLEPVSHPSIVRISSLHYKINVRARACGFAKTKHRASMNLLPLDRAACKVTIR